MKGQKIIIFLISVIVGILAVAVFSKVFLTEEQTGTVTISEAEANGSKKGFKLIASGSMNPGDVLIELTPQYISPNRLMVRFAINTHSVNLSSFNLKEIATLKYGSKIIKPTDATQIRGHHSFGVIVFDLEQQAEHFTITITGIPREQERVFSW